LTLVAVYQAITSLLQETTVARQIKLRYVEWAGFSSLVFLMYAMACPATTPFSLPAGQGPLGLTAWIGFYGYMIASILSFGALQGLFGELAAFQPPSLLAALGTFWIEVLMTVGLVAVIFSTIRKAFASRHTFVGTLSELRRWTRQNFSARNWTRFKAIPHAVEQPFDQGADKTGVPLDALVLLDEPEWTLTPAGGLHHPVEKVNFDVDRYKKKGLFFQLQMAKLFRDALGEKKYHDWYRHHYDKLKYHDERQGLGAVKHLLKSLTWRRAKKALWYVVLLTMLVFLFLILPVGLGPFLIAYFAFGLTAAQSAACALVSSAVMINLATLWKRRRDARAFMVLSSIKNRTLYGDSSFSVSHSNLMLLVEDTNRDVVSALFHEVKRGVRRLARLVRPNPSAQEPPPTDTADSPGKATNQTKPGAVDIIFTGKHDTVWIFRGNPFYAQNNLTYVACDPKRRQLIFVGKDGSEELMDAVTLTKRQANLATQSAPGPSPSGSAAGLLRILTGCKKSRSLLSGGRNPLEMGARRISIPIGPAQEQVKIRAQAQVYPKRPHLKRKHSFW